MSYFNGERIDEPNELDYSLQKQTVIKNPKCPKCGTVMNGGAPHSEGTKIQWECSKCGKIVEVS